MLNIIQRKHLKHNFKVQQINKFEQREFQSQKDQHEDKINNNKIVPQH